MDHDETWALGFWVRPGRGDLPCPRNGPQTREERTLGDTRVPVRSTDLYSVLRVGPRRGGTVPQEVFRRGPESCPGGRGTFEGARLDSDIPAVPGPGPRRPVEPRLGPVAPPAQPRRAPRGEVRSSQGTDQGRWCSGNSTPSLSTNNPVEVPVPVARRTRVVHTTPDTGLVSTPHALSTPA